MPRNQKLMKVIAGRTVRAVTTEPGGVLILFDNESKMKIKTAGPATIPSGGKVKSVHEAKAFLTPACLEQENKGYHSKPFHPLYGTPQLRRTKSFREAACGQPSGPRWERSSAADGRAHPAQLPHPFYRMPCIHSCGSMTPRSFATSNLPLFA
jgi:hypothetical protein